MNQFCSIRKSFFAMNSILDKRNNRLDFGRVNNCVFYISNRQFSYERAKTLFDLRAMKKHGLIHIYLINT